MIRPLLVFSVLALTICPSSFSQQNVPKLEQRVTDFTNTLSYVEWNSLETMLKTFEDTTSTQIAVLIVNSLSNGSIEEYANKTFEENQIGQKSKNNGALLVVSKDDRLVRIEVGYGLEGVLTDAVCSQIIEREIKPRFREANFYGGLYSALISMIRATAGEYSADSAGRQAPFIALALGIVLLVLFLFVFMPIAMSRRKYVIGRKGWSYYPGWGYSSHRGGESSSGGFGGGWSGGGGISGGGGATGRW